MANKTEITDNTPLWWEIQNIPTEIIRELRRRNNTNNIGMNIPQPLSSFTYDFEKNQKNYKGPMTPWVRVFSNSTGKSINSAVPRSVYLDKNNQQVDYDGFILNGGEGFYSAYGYTQGQSLGSKDSNKAIIGYEANGNPHYIDNIYRSRFNYETVQNKNYPQDNQVSPILPPPAITSVSVKQSKEYLTYGKFSFKCFSLAQLEYLTPFFLTAGINVFIEFGWNLFNQKSLLNLNSLNECLEIVNKPQTAIDRSIMSYGNYGCITGIITKYQFNTEDGFIYNCDVETISRQGLYAGMKTDNNAKVEIKSNQEYKDYMDLRTFIRLYLPSINEVMQIPNKEGNPSPANFLNYIIYKSFTSPPTLKEQEKAAKDAQANKEDIKKTIESVQQAINSFAGNLTSGFYDGKPEDRVFIGRLQEVYDASNKPDGKNRVIDYGQISDVVKDTQQISFVNEFDFDSKQSGTKDVWLQLDFVFEMINLFMSNKNKLFKIDIGDVIVNAHPNLISCDKSVLIPNPVAPKLNYGRPAVAQGNGKPFKGGYLKGNNADAKENPFLKQKPDIFRSSNASLDTKIENGTLDCRDLSDDDSLYLAYLAAMKTFRTQGMSRDNLDVIVNYLYYHSINNKEFIRQNRASRNASFPFNVPVPVRRKGKDGKIFEVTYKPYYYGYLKHIYISKDRIIKIAESEQTKNYKQFINAILNVVNESVDNFWKLEIQEAQDSNGDSILSISDKNTINFDVLKEIYTFTLGDTNNVVKSINFDVSLSNEQTVNVLYGGPNTNNLTEELRRGLSTGKTTLNLIDSIPALKFTDRLDKFELKKMAEELNGQTITQTPGTQSGLVDDNRDIADLQTYGEKFKSGVLMMTVKNTKTQSDVKSLDDEDSNPNNFKILCLPSTLKGKLRQMLDDNDYKNNIAKYSGVADNFTITLTFDGIFSLRNLQCFAINNLPKPYVPGNVIFQVLEVEHTIQAGSWKSVVTALVRAIGCAKLDYILV